MLFCQWVLIGMIVGDFLFLLYKDCVSATMDGPAKTMIGIVITIAVTLLRFAIQYGAGAMSEIIQ